MKSAIFILALWLCGTYSSKILAIFPTPLYSHQSVFIPIWKELAERGHQVTVITTNPLSENITNLTVIDLSFTYKLVFEDLDVQRLINSESNIIVLMDRALDLTRNMTEEQLSHPDVQNLLNNKDTFDLLLVELHMPVYFAFAKRFSCPIIGISSMEGEAEKQKLMGNYMHPIINFNFNLPISHEIGIIERTTSILFDIYRAYTDKFKFYPMCQALVDKYFNNTDFNLHVIENNIDLLLHNVIPGFSRPTTKVPNIIDFNGLHIKQPQVLPKDIKDYLDRANDGAIYLSLGSTVKSYLLTDEKVRIFISAFESLPFKVIWKFEDALKHKIPDNVKMVKWAPQQDILRHPNLKLFITQGGIQSIEEALRSCVPMLGIPVFGDQFYNVNRIKKLGLGSALSFKNLDAVSLGKSIMEIVSNKKYKENLNEISDLIKNQPIEALDKVIWWIEYVIRHKGATHLRSSLHNMPFYKYYLLDILLFLFILSASAYVCIKKAVSLIKLMNVSKRKQE